jgi:hypothetical protein
MRKFPHENKLHLAMQYLAEGESRVLRQQRLIALLKSRHSSTERAEDILKGFQQTLQKLRNHIDIMRELMPPREPSSQLSSRSRYPRWTVLPPRSLG